MRILQTIKNFDFGGSENHVCELSNELAKLGHEVYICGSPGRQTQRLSNNVQFIPSKQHRILFLWNLLQLIRIVRKHRIQQIHAHQRYAIHLSSIAGLLTGTPVVVTVHGRSQYDLRSWFSRRFAKKIIFVSAYVMERSNRFHDIQHKIVLIPNGIQVNNLNRTPNPNRMSYVSRIDKRHSSVILLMLREVLPTMLHTHPNLAFTVIGEGTVLPQIRQEAEALNQQYNREICRFEGYQPEVANSIQDAALVMGVGRVALEALACGTPVLSVNKKRMGSLLSTQNYPFFQANNFVAVRQPAPDAEKLIQQLTDFFDHPDFWQEETKKLQKQVIDTFRCEIMAERIASIYKEQ